MKKPRAMTWAAVRKIGLGFPGVEEGTSYGTPSLHAKRKFLARTFFVTDHYRGYPSLLVHLSKVTPAVLREVLEQAWRVNAPRRLVQEYDSA